MLFLFLVGALLRLGDGILRHVVLTKVLDFVLGSDQDTLFGFVGGAYAPPVLP
jgi:hypothetical protein